MRHSILWAAQVRAVSSSSQAAVPPSSSRGGLPAATPPSILPEPEPRPGALPWSSALRAALLPMLTRSALLPRSFCWEHRPRQAAEAAPTQNTVCVICLEPVGDSTSYHTMVCPVCKQAWFHRGCIRVGALPSPCGHGRCSAAPSPAHAHACASPAETCPARCHHALLLPRLRRKKAIPIPNDHAGDPNSSQVGVLLPGSEDTQALPPSGTAPPPAPPHGRPGPLPSSEHWSQLGGEAGNELVVDEQGCPGSASRPGHRDSSHSPSSLADDYLGGTTQHTSRCEKGTGAAMPACAST